MRNKYIIPLMFFFFIIVILIYTIYLNFYAHKSDGYIIGDWLINFDGGFVRRGLGGYLIIIISELINIKPNLAVFSIQLIIYLSFIIILFKLLYKKILNFWFIIILLSPATLLFPILDPRAIGRKEIILFFLFALYIVCLNKHKVKSNLTIFTFSIVLAICTFFHELLFFYTPYFIFATYVYSKTNNVQFNFKKYFFIPLGSFLAIIPLYLYGININGPVICTGLIEKGLPNSVCHGILNWPNNFSSKDAFEMAISYNYFWNYGISLLLGLVPFVLFVNQTESRIVSVKHFFVGFLIVFLFSLPLFILAVDWGRWLNIHFILLLITSTFLLKNKPEISQKKWSNESLVVPLLWKSEKTIFKLSNTLILFIICISYLSLWHMAHYGEFSLFGYNAGHIIHNFLKLINLSK
jgi:hypothetical protein